ncbi:MAG: 4-(cytidine 5'-diphospho)-2-C-methyl-D-erythritol kinase, partial [Oscillospiraceae bacterium]|nr:4-(cytidine 5'-diphospho)-2-C-methyl-D-erythritol kinase [Oscillospiraceae bacterium]
LGAVMTGTGSAVFGIFTDGQAAEGARAALAGDYPFSCTAKPVQKHAR